MIDHVKDLDGHPAWTKIASPTPRNANLASFHFRPDRLAFQDSVATSAGLQPFDPAATSPVPVIRKQLCFDSAVAK